MQDTKKSPRTKHLKKLIVTLNVTLNLWLGCNHFTTPDGSSLVNDVIAKLSIRTLT